MEAKMRNSFSELNNKLLHCCVAIYCYYACFHHYFQVTDLK